MAETSNPKTKTEPDLSRYYNVVTATGLGFQIGVAGDTAFQFLKGLHASPKGVSTFHRLGSACQNVRLRPYASILAAVVGSACALHKAHDKWLRPIQDIQDTQKVVLTKDQSPKGRFCETAYATGLNFHFGLIGGSAYHFLRALDGGGSPRLGCAFRAVRLNTLGVAGKFGAWSLLSDTLIYASSVALKRNYDDSWKTTIVADAAAIGLLSARRGLPAAAAFATLAGGMELLLAGLDHCLLQDNQPCKQKACKEGVEAEHVDNNIQDMNPTQQAEKTNTNMVEEQDNVGS
ncbi:uncharacterized protein LOC110264190 isoform X1 [Arachis ipaensis]|uniref:uncharacterized protein LOC110264190 isoform X1 n=1 Tax=Arachis ipaensis TaxID=130454 RepID=UPI000A2B2DC2|nr:uncharacterized protein LOC110264190 isoform X1 [Arachis ipaensis]XP_025660268.1 uncharacterized protein LOC112756063 isoform X1 [Arachis hypogaea]